MKTNYKITNKVSGNTQIMNQEEKDIFFSQSKTQMSNWDKYGKRNMYGDYDIQKITYLDKIPLWLITSVMIIATISSILLHIQLNY
jgi:hypothetical protein